MTTQEPARHEEHGTYTGRGNHEPSKWRVCVVQCARQTVGETKY